MHVGVQVIHGSSWHDCPKQYSSVLHAGPEPQRHCPLVHASPSPQAKPQAPQWFVEVSDVSHPLPATPSQLPHPDEQASSSQEASEQSAVACA